MPMRMFAIAKYTVHLYGPSISPSTQRASISVEDASLQNRAHLLFYNDGEAHEEMTRERMVGSTCERYFAARFSEFALVLDLLRNEKPVYLYPIFDRYMISTSLEPVGEGEGPTP